MKFLSKLFVLSSLSLTLISSVISMDDLSKQYFCQPSRFNLKVQYDNKLPKEFFPITVSFQSYSPESRAILIDMANASIPEHSRLSGHEHLKLPCNWYNPQPTYRKDLSVDFKWINFLSKEQLFRKIDNDINYSFVEHSFPLAIIFGADESVTTEYTVVFETNSGLINERLLNLPSLNGIKIHLKEDNFFDPNEQ